ncbi:MAG: PQQ-binding-like beta-propeller repeat protein [Thermoanaerobaculia bacterium]
MLSSRLFPQPSQLLAAAAVVLGACSALGSPPSQPQASAPAVEAPVRELARGKGILAVTCAGDGAMAWVGRTDGSVSAVEVATGKLLWRQDLAPGGLLAVAAVPGGRLLAGSSEALWLLEAGSGTVVRQLRRPDLDLAALAISPRGDWAALAGRSGELLRWDLQGSEPPRRLLRAEFPLLAVYLAPPGERLLAISADGRGRVLGAEDGRVEAEFGLPSSNEAVTALSPEGAQLLMSGGRLPTLCLYSLPSGKESSCLAAEEPVWTASAAFEPGGRRVVWADPEGRLHRWDLAGGRPLPAISTPAAASSLAFCSGSGGASILLAGGEDGTLLAWALPD